MRDGIKMIYRQEGLWTEKEFEEMTFFREEMNKITRAIQKRLQGAKMTQIRIDALFGIYDRLMTRYKEVSDYERLDDLRSCIYEYKALVRLQKIYAEGDYESEDDVKAKMEDTDKVLLGQLINVVRAFTYVKVVDTGWNTLYDGSVISFMDYVTTGNRVVEYVEGDKNYLYIKVKE